MPEPAAPAAAYRDPLAAISDVLLLWPRCARSACRRGGACRGFSGELYPRCLPLLLDALGERLDGVVRALPSALARAADPAHRAAEALRAEVAMTRRILRIVEEIDPDAARKLVGR